MGGERVIFDTNVVSFYLGGDPAFRPGLQGLVNQLKRRQGRLYVSTVTVQEFLVFAAVNDKLERARQILYSTFTPLPFDERAAVKAAELGGRMPLAKTASGSERNRWHRDIAILGTALAHGMDRVVTADEKDFSPFRDLLSCTIEVVRPINPKP
jgi:predicted nucleic acid-binding protein